jgi:FtsZ-interacting cell division protein ZipA
MSGVRDQWLKMESSTRTLVILVITAIVILIVLLLIRKLVLSNKRKDNSNSRSSSSDSSNSSGSSTSSDSSHWTKSGHPVNQSKPVQFQEGFQAKQEQSLDSQKLVGSAGVVLSTCGDDVPCADDAKDAARAPAVQAQPAHDHGQKQAAASESHVVPPVRQVNPSKARSARSTHVPNPTLNRSAMPAPRPEQIVASHQAPEEIEVKSERRVRFAGKNDD